MIVPAPRRLDYRGDEFTLTEATTLYADPAAIPAATALRRSLSPATGFAFADAEQGLADIVLTVDPVHLPPQGYQLNASASGVEISGGDAAGVFYGVQALRQLLPTEIFSIGRVDRTWSVPGISVEDRPRCGWRGVMLDVTRHFLGKDYVFALLDLLALHRLNVLHLHLNDDQGWRVEIPAHPKLTEVAAWRSETLIGHESQPEGERSFDGTPHGGYFDHYQSERTDNEPLGIGGHTPLEKVYEFDPIPAELRDDEEAAERVLGAQCQLWTEYVPTPEHADYMLFPRVCAFAEAVWRAEPDSYSAFLERLGEHLGRLDALGVHYRPLDKP